MKTHHRVLRTFLEYDHYVKTEFPTREQALWCGIASPGWLPGFKWIKQAVVAEHRFKGYSWFQAGSRAMEELKNKGWEPRDVGLAGKTSCLPQRGKPSDPIVRVQCGREEACLWLYLEPEGLQGRFSLGWAGGANTGD